MDFNAGDISLIVPTLNAGANWNRWIESLKKQVLKPEHILLIDSSSTDNTVDLALNADLRVDVIARQAFNHGGTRQLGVNALLDCKIIIFLTQDAILADEYSIYNIVKSFKDANIGASYGRQLPHANLHSFGTHARLFNYPVESNVKSMEDASTLGIKTAFISNSFAAYRREALMAVGGFPQHTILGEDTYVAAKMLLAGWKVAYCAEAKVYHSHDYNFLQEFKRYFDIGVFHACEPWIRDEFGKAEGEGLKFVLSEAKYLISNGKGYLLPSAFIRTLLKYLGYRLGMIEKIIPVCLKKHLSMYSCFWRS